MKSCGFVSWGVVLLWAVLVGVARGVIEICTPGRTSAVYRITKEDCPFGVLFTTPVDSACFQTNDADIDNYLADLCSNELFSSNPSQIHVISSIDDSEVPESCSGGGRGRCNTSEVIFITRDTFTPPILAGAEGYEGRRKDLPSSDLRNDSKVFQQTKRLFNYLINLEYPSEEELEASVGGASGGGGNLEPLYEDVKSPPRILKLLEMSFWVVQKHVDARFVQRDFKNDVEHAFVFLVREAFEGSGVITDIPQDDFDLIAEALEGCVKKETPFTVEGKLCRTYQTIDWIANEGKRVFPKEDEFSFQPEVVDLPTDAAYVVMDFVHGLCYATFKEHVNHHHLYERAVERLFNFNEIEYRWTRPPLLVDERIWNKMFSTPSVLNTMRNLEAFTQAAYAKGPFLHRLERSFLKYPGYSGNISDDEPLSDIAVEGPPPTEGSGAPPPTAAPAQDGTTGAPPTEAGETEAPPADGTTEAPAEGTTEAPAEGGAPTEAPPPAARRRRRRGLEERKVPTMEQRGLRGGGWCFQTEEEQRETILTYIFEKCRGEVVKDFKNALPWLFRPQDSDEYASRDEL